MAGIEASIRSILTADSDVSALVSTRVFPYLRQQGTAFPAIVYELEDTEPQQGLDGFQSLTRCELSVTNVAETYSGAKDLASKVRTALNGYTGTSEGVAIKSVVHDNDIGIVEDSRIGNSRGVSIIESSYIVWYSE
jgi:hypothetical protein|tara:strand:+ start:222 stop:629 length:408 start_codon:yes stop_codon:yes gene_type:complete